MAKTKKEIMITDILQALKAGGGYITGDHFFTLIFKSERELIKICNELYISTK